MILGIRSVGLVAVLSAGLICSTAFAWGDSDLVKTVKSHELQSCGGKTLQTIVEGSAKNLVWTGKENTGSGNLVNIEGKFKNSGALMAMQFKVNDDDSLNLRLMMVNGMVLSPSDRLFYINEMCKVVR
ncbi:hypothetical protein NFHSH190041_06870 [Shewanella sp. NFH-SH190041]|uniref:hypothetical protein n=1 Tax=Shewanella sp. NFH-SH190041 TaxID=2950245 RepID=UPI0021C30071|nr:hypothetical protein [Shewanella sp. NFH-SH190041]BDM63235.1 hypothetical protein NFHSH190041_06870 [Shewanella sp. NFH-SH190041]